MIFLRIIGQKQAMRLKEVPVNAQGLFICTRVRQDGAEEDLIVPFTAVEYIVDDHKEAKENYQQETTKE